MPAERTHFIAAPAANAGRAAEEVLLRERHLGLIVASRVDGADLDAVRDDEPLAHRKIVPAVS